MLLTQAESRYWPRNTRVPVLHFIDALFNVMTPSFLGHLAKPLTRFDQRWCSSHSDCYHSILLWCIRTKPYWKTVQKKMVLTIGGKSFPLPVLPSFSVISLR